MESITIAMVEEELWNQFCGLLEMTFGLVNASFSLPEWQAVKMLFFAPWTDIVSGINSEINFFMHKNVQRYQWVLQGSNTDDELNFPRQSNLI